MRHSPELFQVERKDRPHRDGACFLLNPRLCPPHYFRPSDAPPPPLYHQYDALTSVPHQSMCNVWLAIRIRHCHQSGGHSSV